MMSVLIWAPILEMQTLIRKLLLPFFPTLHFFYFSSLVAVKVVDPMTMIITIQLNTVFLATLSVTTYPCGVSISFLWFPHLSSNFLLCKVSRALQLICRNTCKDYDSTYYIKVCITTEVVSYMIMRCLTWHHYSDQIYL